ncbi:shikimate kinase [Anaerofustis stercorihominis]|uniref:shikimate kinase n=1 Tax=Anaerofustis stercorihominis TaxID=214853 RepID=UPI001105A328|nr:shikimate kinase [Anaerofustis stercorihominis]
MQKNILLIGMPGCGKSSIGKELASKLGLTFIDMDNYIEEKTNKKISEIFKDGEESFRDIETFYSKELSKLNSTLISSGGGIVTRKENIDYFKQTSIIVFINRSVENILKSKNLGKDRPLLKNNEEHIYNLYNNRIGLYKKYCDIEVSNNGYFKYCIENIIKELNKKNVL